MNLTNLHVIFRVKKGDPVNVKNAATIAASASGTLLAPACMLQRPS